MKLIFDPILKFCYRHGLCKMISLEKAASHIRKHPVLLIGFDTFGQRYYAKVGVHVYDIVQYLLCPVIYLRPVEETHIYLYDINGHIL